jgi:multidrug efflux pump subunit AcrA (membrane-fusion protein)
MHKVPSTADSKTRAYPIEVRVDDPVGLKPGMVATVVFRKEARAYLLPLTSVAPGEQPRSTSVYRLEDDGGRSVVRQVPLRFDDVLDNKIAVRVDSPSGLRPGDRVVAFGVHRLHDGLAVHVVQ